MRRRIFTLMLIFLFVVTCFQGCTKKEKEKEETNGNKKTVEQTVEQIEEQSDEKVPEMGRFMESKVSFPEFEDGEGIVRIVQNADNQIELYTNADNKYLCYQLQEDMTWKSSEPGWLNDGKLKGKDIEFNVLCYGEDGNYYASYINYGTDCISHIIKSVDGGKTAVEIEIPYLEEGETITDSIIYPMIRRLGVLANGNLVISDGREGKSLLIFSPEGKELDKLSVANAYDEPCFITSGNNIITVAEDNKSIIFYNTETKAIDRTVEYGAGQNTKAFTQKADGTLLMCDTNGIHRLTKDGSLWETTVDGALNSMSMPSLYLDSLFVIEGGEGEEQYYVTYIDNDAGYQLMHYVYDKNVSAVPAHEITVYSLQENNTIRQAISLFQSKNTDIRINYIVSMGEEGGTVSDYIRALNTEILSGNGADILVLDGLPVDAYLEKGVLADMSDIMKPLMDSDALLSNITDYYNTEGKIYQMPLRFSVPIIIGKKDSIPSIQNMDSILSYMEDNQGIPYANPLTYRQLLQNYLALYSKELYIDGKLKEEKLVTFLESLKKIAVNSKATEFDEDNRGASDSEDGFVDTNKLFTGSILGLVNNKYCTGMTRINSIYFAMDLFAISKDNTMAFSSINQMFIPKGVLGLNSASKELDIAKQFIAFLFSEEVQNSNVYDGFPINSNSLNKWMDEESEITSAASDAEGNMVTASWPSKEERESLLAMIHELTAPIELNQVINGIMLEETLPFFTGEIDAEQAASAAVTKINLYLEE